MSIYCFIYFQSEYTLQFNSIQHDSIQFSSNPHDFVPRGAARIAARDPADGVKSSSLIRVVELNWVLELIWIVESNHEYVYI